MSEVSRVLLVEDEPFILGLLTDYLTGLNYEVHVASNAAEAREKLDTKAFDAAILDIQLGQGPNGFDLATVARKIDPHIGLVFLTNLPNPKMLEIESRVNFRNSAYLVKSRLNDLEVIDHNLKRVLKKETGRADQQANDGAEGAAELSRSQLAVLRMVAEGMSNKEIAALRETSIRAVETLLHRALSSLGIGDDPDYNMRVIALREYLRVTGQLRDSEGQA